MHLAHSILYLLLGFGVLPQDNSSARLVIKSFVIDSPHVVLCPEPSPVVACSSGKNVRLTLRVEVNPGEKTNLDYQYSVTGGRIIGTGPIVVWEFHEARPGQYDAKVRVKGRRGYSASRSTRVTFEVCGTCDPPLGPFPEINLSCPAIVIEGKPALISVRLNGPGSRGRFQKIELNWSLSAGKIMKGAGTRTIKVDTRDLAGQTISATVDVAGLDPSANRRASCTTQVVRK